MSVLKKPELVAPAGNIQKLKTALSYGADAVYLGLPNFSLRARMNDFDNAGIKEGVEFAHSLNKKVYVTLNVFARNSHFKNVKKHILFLKNIKVDGIFVSDPGMANLIKHEWPEVKLVLSTQANCTNYATASFWRENGFSRIVLARELSLEEVVEIKNKVPKMEIECFVHGALCMSYSGRCLLSSFFSGREANLGDCSQPCRWKLGLKFSPNDSSEVIEVEEDCDGSYIFNSKDLRLIRRIPELMMAKIDAFKIEGRAKSVYYLANVVGMYRKVIDEAYDLLAKNNFNNNCLGNKNFKKLLVSLEKDLNNKIFNRGYTEGFMFGEKFDKENRECSHVKVPWEFCGQFVKSNKNGSYFESYFMVHNTVKSGDVVEIVQPFYDVSKVKITKMFNIDGGCINEAHGGTGKIIFIKTKSRIKEYSIIRRKTS